MITDSHARKHSSLCKAWRPVADDRYGAPRARNKWIGLNHSNEA